MLKRRILSNKSEMFFIEYCKRSVCNWRIWKTQNVFA